MRREDPRLGDGNSVIGVITAICDDMPRVEPTRRREKHAMSARVGTTTAPAGGARESAVARLRARPAGAPAYAGGA